MITFNECNVDPVNVDLLASELILRFAEHKGETNHDMFRIIDYLFHPIPSDIDFLTIVLSRHTFEDR